MKKSIEQELQNILWTEWKGKCIWELIRDKVLTAFTALEGTQYKKSAIKIMYVGMATNGWELDIDDSCECEDVFNAIVNQNEELSLQTIVCKGGIPYTKNDGKEGIYFHKKSKFWRLIKHILEFQNESDVICDGNQLITDDSWYLDSKSWQQKIVWSNFYCIAPRYSGNPTSSLANKIYGSCVEMFRLQIKAYEPDFVIFCPLKNWFSHKNLNDMIDNYKPINIDDTILGVGNVGQSNVIICSRPDSRGKSYADVKKMAEIISDYINMHKPYQRRD